MPTTYISVFWCLWNVVQLLNTLYSFRSEESISITFHSVTKDNDIDNCTTKFFNRR